ncbi:hypothetical protein AWB71_04255 [Caballeronia peredens]|nr:hypothetical protein AWB71_04255 [Caballeronia peredens]
MGAQNFMMLPAVTFTPLAGLGDNYLQISLLLNWAESQDSKIVIVFHSDGSIPPPEQRAVGAIYVQTELIDLLMPSSKAIFARLPARYLFPPNPAVVHALSPPVMFDRRLLPYYWPLNRNRFAQCAIPAKPYVAIAFDFVSHGRLKSFTDDEVDIIVGQIEAQGYQIVDVGGSRPLAEKAYIIDRAAAFVGGASGLAHLASGLHTPAFIYLPETDLSEFWWYTDTLRLNGAHYQDGIRRPDGSGLNFDLHLPPLR